jgi:hypothetical protein
MIGNPSLPATKRYMGRLMIGAIALLVLAAILVVASAVLPIRVDVEAHRPIAPRGIQPLTGATPDLKPLLARMAGTPLIKPAQVQAAVKDTGAAERLLKSLKLQGVVQMGPDLVAYIAVEKQGTKSVRRGEKVLDFVVKEIESGRVTLTLEGVEVILGH